MRHRVSTAVRIRESAARPKPWVPTLSVRVVALLLLAVVGVGCPCIRGPVNASPALRWWLFSNFGAQRICPEMLKRSAPLALTPGTNTIGRFYPEQCSTVVNDAAQTVTLNFAGSGLAWTPIGGRLGFQVSASIEYRMDFFMAEEGVYVWARPNRTLAGPEFKVLSVEYKVANWAAQGPAGYLVNTFGSQIVQAQLASGFTVVHTDDGDEFAIGQLQPPQRPPKPFATDEGRFIFANETTEVHAEQIDLLGPFEVVDSDQALYLRLFVKGPAVDVLVLYRGAGGSLAPAAPARAAARSAAATGPHDLLGCAQSGHPAAYPSAARPVLHRHRQQLACRLHEPALEPARSGRRQRSGRLLRGRARRSRRVESAGKRRRVGPELSQRLLYTARPTATTSVERALR